MKIDDGGAVEGINEGGWKGEKRGEKELLLPHNENAWANVLFFKLP